MTTTIQPGSQEPTVTPVAFSHIATAEPATRTTSDDRARPIRFTAPVNRPRP
jgi:hypothetical protein